MATVLAVMPTDVPSSVDTAEETASVGTARQPVLQDNDSLTVTREADDSPKSAGDVSHSPMAAREQDASPTTTKESDIETGQTSVAARQLDEKKADVVADDGQEIADEDIGEGSTTFPTEVSDMATCKWVAVPDVFFRRPEARMLVVFLILLQDFLLYGEDPVNDSHVECNLPGMGHLLNLLTVWRVHVGVAVLRVVLILLSVLAGMYVGRQWLHHRLLRDYWGLSMFSYCDGSWGAMGVTVVAFLFLSVVIHNLLVTQDAITSATGIEMRMFGKLTQTCSATADMVAIVQVCDTVLQDRHRYPKFLRGFKRVWLEKYGGWIRIGTTWILFVSAIVTCVVAIQLTGKDPESIQWNDRRIGGFSEVARSWLLSSIIFCDLFTVFQDWEFPTFAPAIEADPIYIAGTFTTNLQCNCLGRFFHYAARCMPDCTIPQSLKDFLRFRVTGQWLAYGPLLGVVCIDLFCARMQLTYDPKDYGQYTDPHTHRIWTVIDQSYLQLVYDRGTLIEANKYMLSYEARRNITTGEPLTLSAATDFELNARYFNSPVKYIAVMPGFAVLFLFMFLVVGGERAKRFEAATGVVAMSLARTASAPMKATVAPNGSTGQSSKYALQKTGSMDDDPFSLNKEFNSTATFDAVACDKTRQDRTSLRGMSTGGGGLSPQSSMGVARAGEPHRSTASSLAPVAVPEGSPRSAAKNGDVTRGPSRMTASTDATSDLVVAAASSNATPARISAQTADSHLIPGTIEE